MNQQTASEVSAKLLADRLLLKLGESLELADLQTNAEGLVRISIERIGLLDFELYEEQRCMAMLIDVGKAPADLSVLLRANLEHAEMAGFGFALDGFKSQALLTAAVCLDGLEFASFREIYQRLISCAIYWRERLRGGQAAAADFSVSAAIAAPADSGLANFISA